MDFLYEIKIVTHVSKFNSKDVYLNKDTPKTRTTKTS